ncbi:MAG: hypothetical protein NTV02_00760 [Candidatus Zambryskibacteria bacterium]|nr:hypothetical protein [Candidatus Zambryskibacteria bacterium]
MKNNIKESVVTFCLVLFAVLLLNPFHFWMPDAVLMGVLLCALVIFGIFAIFILREQVLDERDNLHRRLAGRNAFLAGAGILMLGIVVQGYSHNVDPWLVAALVGMVVVKVVSRVWSDKNL